MFANLFDVMNIEEVNSLQKPSATGNFHLNGISHYFGANYKIWKKNCWCLIFCPAMLRFFKLCSFVIFIRAPILKRKECKSLLKRCLQDLPDSIFTIGSEEINWNSSKKMFFQQMPLPFSILRYSVVDKEVPPQFALDIISKVFCRCLKFETKSSSVKMLLRNYGSDVCSALSGPRRPSVGSPYLRVCY